MRKKSKPKAATRATRSVSLVVRVNPEVRYLAEIAARLQRRTVSSFAEWAIEQALYSNQVILDQNETVGALRFELWDVDEADRFATLALRYPGLLTHEEQVLWKLIANEDYYWKKVKTDKDGWLTWDPIENNLDWEKLREWWDVLRKVAKGEQPRSVLPEREEQPIADAEGRDSDSGQGDQDG
jgi:uncharacterized protein (DUF1778 family)